MKNLGTFGIALLLSVAAPGADNKSAGPAYDTTTVIDTKATVTEVRVVKDQPLNGVHLMVKIGLENVDLYVGPAEFVKIFDVNFSKGDEVRLIGSKVTYEGATVILAREVTLGKVTLNCRENDGTPLWKYFLKPSVG